jgi:hypothetical protein
MESFQEMIVRVLIILACLVFFVASTYGSLYAQEGTWNVYENATLGFKISYLSDWVYIETNQQLDSFAKLNGVLFTPATQIGFREQQNVPGIIFYAVKLITPVKNLPLAFFMNNSQSLFMNIPATTVISNETIILENNVSAFKVNLISNDADGQKSGAVMVISKSPDVFFAGYSATPSNWIKYTMIVQNMINSLEFVP